MARFALFLVSVCGRCQLPHCARSIQGENWSVGVTPPAPTRLLFSLEVKGHKGGSSDDLTMRTISKNLQVCVRARTRARISPRELNVLRGYWLLGMHF